MRDVVVVGAGPAGSHAARRCAEAGLDVLLLDAATFPRDKACGGIVGDAAVRLVGPDVLALREREAVGNELFYDWRRIGRLDVRLHCFKRRRFDHHLVRKAVAAGAELREGRRVTGVAVKPDGAVVAADGESHEARLVIGADGTNSVVGRALGLSHHDGPWRYASIKAEVALSPAQGRALGIEDPVPHQDTHFFSDLVGFAWVVPNAGSVNAGLGATVRHAAHLRERFLAFLRHLGLPPTDVQGAQIPYRPLRRVHADRVLLTGDAGGFVDPWTGCGIEDGIEASERAAAVARMAADRGDFTAGTLRAYEDASADHLRRLRRRARWVQAVDVAMPVGAPFPSWVRQIVTVAARLA